MLKKRHFIYLAPDGGTGEGGAPQDPNPQDLPKQEPAKPEMTEAEKAMAEINKVREETLKEYKQTFVDKLGLDEEFASLIKGNTADEIKASGNALKKLLEKTKADATTEAKKTIANTGAPGSGGQSAEMDDIEFYRSILGGI